jgi:protein-tyrosine phosphatase
LGADFDKYSKEAARRSIEIIRLPILDGAAPESIEEIESTLTSICEIPRIILCHCRGGVGRAGLIACCYLIRTGYFRTAKDAIQYMRHVRNPKG